MSPAMTTMTTRAIPRAFGVSAPFRGKVAMTVNLTRRNKRNVSGRDVFSTRTRASTGLYDDETFAATVLGKYPDSHEMADTEEARVLWENGYVALDVRADAEIDFEGRVPNPPHPGAARGDRVREVPLVRASRVYDSEAGKKVYRQEPVDANAFTQAVAAACVSDGGNEAKLLVMDGDGGARAKKAAELLSTSGFRNVVVVRGGANAWKNAWDSTMRRRQLAGSFSRGFDNPMFADSNVTAEEFGASTDDTVWVV